MEKPKSAVSITKWGAACAHCATAKAKCVRSHDEPQGKCNRWVSEPIFHALYTGFWLGFCISRCRGLEKECTAQVHKPRKKRVAKPSWVLVLILYYLQEWGYPIAYFFNKPLTKLWRKRSLWYLPRILCRHVRETLKITWGSLPELLQCVHSRLFFRKYEFPH